jgi:CheY-like chemotaxis protein
MEEAEEITFEAAAVEAEPEVEATEQFALTNGYDYEHADHKDETVTMASPESFEHVEEAISYEEVIDAAPEYLSFDEAPAVSAEPSLSVTEEFSVQDLTADDIQEISVEEVSEEPAAEFEPSIHETVAADIHETQADMPASYDDVVSEQIVIKALPDEQEEVANDPFATVAEFSIPMPSQQIPEPVEKANPFATKFDPVFVRKAQPSSDLPVTCSFCKATNEAASIQCGTCMAVLTLADLDTILNNEKADRVAIRHAVERMETERAAMNYGEAELTMLGIGHLNLGNLQHGYNYLYEAARINPDNIVLSSQVNALLIRLDDVRKHDETAESMTRGKTILVVDDSATVRKLIAGKLEKCGHTVFCSPDGVDAMSALQDVAPDLILLDINMPRMDGYQTCKAIRSKDETKNIPIVMISGKDGFFDKVRGRMAGTTGYITKPFGPETLMKTVETYLSSNGEAQHPEVISE